MELEKAKFIAEARYNTFRFDTGVDELREQLKKLKLKLETAEHSLGLKTLDCNDFKEECEKLKIQLAAQQNEKPKTCDAKVQTDLQTGATFVQQMNWEQANARAEKYKDAYLEAVKMYHDIRSTQKELNAEKSKLEAEKSTLEAKYNELNAELENVRTKSGGVDKEMEMLRSKYNNTKIICEQRRITLQKYEQNQKDLESELNVLHAKYDELKKFSTDLETKCRETCSSLDQLNEKYSKAKALFVELKAKYDELREKNAETEEKYRRSKIYLQQHHDDRVYYTDANEKLIKIIQENVDPNFKIVFDENVSPNQQAEQNRQANQ